MNLVELGDHFVHLLGVIGIARLQFLFYFYFLESNIKTKIADALFQ
jgi:hypothetical protein